MKSKWLIAFFSLAMNCCTFAPVSDEPQPDLKENIRSTVRAHLKDVRQCYKAHPEADGKLVVTWDIDEAGSVQKAVADSTRTTLKSESLTNCILSTSKTWKFPAGAKGMTQTVTYPFVFSPH